MASSDGPFRVLHTHTLPVVSGSGINTFLSMSLLDPSRWKTAMASAPGGALEVKVREAGLEFIPIPHFVQEVSPISDLRALFEVERAIRDYKPAIIHTHNSKAGFIGRLAGRRVGIGRIVHTVHGFSFHSEESPIRRRIFLSLERLAFNWADAVIAISRPLAEWGASAGLGHLEDYRIIHSGIDLEEFAPRRDRDETRAELGIGRDEIAIGLVSKIWKGKGHAVLLEAACKSNLGPVKIVFIGEGPEEDRLRRMASELGISDSLIWTGFREDVARLAGALDIAVLPSLFEGMGRVIIEAEALGIPVVASRVGGIPDIVLEDETAILVPPGDAEALGRALEDLVSDPGRRERMGKAGHAFVDERFSARRMADEIEKVYMDLMRKDEGG